VLVFGAAPGVGRSAETGWQFSLGGAVLVSPKYPGSNRLSAFAFPDFEATYDDWFFVSPVDGIGAGFQPAPGLTLSAAIGVDFDERRAQDDPRFTGLKDINYAPDARLNARYERPHFFIDATLHSRLGAAPGRGTQADVDVGHLFFSQRPHYFSAGATATLMDATYAGNFFGLTPAQAAITGLPAYEARRGLKDAGVFAECDRGLGRHWELFARLQFSQLQPRAAHSPIVLAAFQPSLLLTTVWHF
jgi:outer membrane scaffolding protein for murein synthesis (MipA/OmpV family)